MKKMLCCMTILTAVLAVPVMADIGPEASWANTGAKMTVQKQNANGQLVSVATVNIKPQSLAPNGDGDIVSGTRFSVDGTDFTVSLAEHQTSGLYDVAVSVDGSQGSAGGLLKSKEQMIGVGGYQFTFNPRQS